MEKEYLIRQNPMRAMLVLAFPMIVGNLFQQFYNMVDSVIVGRYVGEDALAAVGASYALTYVFISIATGGGIGASVLTGRAFGRRDYDRMKRSISTALLSFLTLSILLGTFGLLASGSIMSWLKTPDNIMEDAQTYLNIYFLGLPFLFMYNVLASMFNALGRSRIPLYLLIFSSVLNVILDIIMVRGFGLGVAGVAWATLIAQGVSALTSFTIFLKELKTYPSTAKLPCFNISELKNMVRIALPSIFQQSTVSIGLMLVQSSVNVFGSDMLAGYSAGTRIESLCLVPMLAMGNAMSAYTAQNIGAGQFDRVREGYRTAVKIIGCFALLIAAITIPLAEPIISLFLKEEGVELALRTGMARTQFVGWFYFFAGLKMTTDGLLRGSGDMTMFTVANLANLTLRVTFTKVMTPIFGISMTWVAVPLGWFINFVISFCEFRTGKWQKKNEKF
ncbi:MAG: MATE family efflux transporter [Firmicutes bacterium]|nr:MATE family efflux transporter [Bacillota bacterium]